jgi:alpha-methylacyl-CoA racemase
MTPPLSHVRVLDLTRLYPGAFCTQLLADLGADVLKVEAPRFGDGMRLTYGGTVAPGHVALNRGKRSLTLDLKKPRAAEVLRRLVAGVDVLVESQRPGVLDQMGAGYDALRVVNPRLVWCSLTGFGQNGPLADAPGHDITYLGYSGLLSRLAGGGRLPVPDTTIAVPLAGALGAVGILAALAARERTGEGSRVDTSMAEAAVWLVTEDVTRSAIAPGPPGWGDMAARQHYRCADGRWVTVAATEPKPWGSLCAALGLPDLVNHRHGTDEEATIERLAAAFAARPAAHWTQTPGLAGGVGPVNEPGDLLDDPHQAARAGIVELPGGVDGTRVVANPVRVSGEDGRGSSAGLRWPPDLGADTDAALAAAGFTPDEIGALHDDGVV